MIEQWNPEIWSPNQASTELINMNKRMDQIAELAKAYSDATPEQRANVDAGAVQALMNEYEQLKQQRNALIEDRARHELLYYRRLEEQQAQAAQAAQGQWIRRRTPNPDTVVTPTEPTNPGTVTIAYSKSWAPYYLDTTTWNQVAPIQSMNNGTVRIVDSQWNISYLPNINWEQSEWIARNWETAGLLRNTVNAYDNAEAVRDQTVRDYMEWAFDLMNLYNLGRSWIKYWLRYLNGKTPVPANVYKNSVLNSDYNSVMSNPSYEALRTRPSTFNVRLSNPVSPQQGINAAVNNTYKWVLSNPTYNGLKTVPNTLRWVNQVAQQQAVSSALNNGWRWTQTAASYVSPQLRTVTSAATTPVSTPNIVNSWGELSRVRWY